MLNHLGYAALDGDLPASLSPRAYALLRAMGFTGVAMTDSLGMGAVNLRWDFPDGGGARGRRRCRRGARHRRRPGEAHAGRAGGGRALGGLPEARLSLAAARVTALAGGDPVAMSCVAVELPQLALGAG